MGLLQKAWQFGRRLVSSSADPHSTSSKLRICRVEEMEPRRLMTADLHIGAVYYEPHGGTDTQPNTIQITWSGGAPGTELTHLIIDGSKQGGPLNFNDAVFDTAPGGIGAFGSSPLQIVSHDGFNVVSATAIDGGTKLDLALSGWNAGETLSLSVDVDQVLFVDSSTNTVEVDAIDEGAEFQRSHMIATFVAPHFADLTSSTQFWDEFDGNFSTADTASGSHLSLPNDHFTGDIDNSVYTAGAVDVQLQTPLPITISGNVFVDNNLNNTQNAGEPGLAGVTLSLWQLGDSGYTDTGKTAVTDTQGHYKFDGVLPGTYRVTEAQPSGYFSVGAAAGTVDGSTDGTVTSPDIVSNIVLLGGQDSVQNNFAEAQPASLSGFVYHDRNNNGVRNPGEEGIGGVKIEVQPISVLGGGTTVIDTTTAADGSWSVSGLIPGTYRVVEVNQPAGYLDGLDAAGSAGGTAVNPGDQINGIALAGAQSGVEYDFGELLPSTIKGHVEADPSGDCDTETNPINLSGVTIQLLDGNGKLLKTTTTDESGNYQFSGLAPGVYSVHEIQPAGYLQGESEVGSVGGTVPSTDTIANIALTSGTNATDYDFCENLPLTLSGYVYRDDNNNGVFDPGETPLAGVKLHLLDGNGQPTGATAQTDATGFYKFEGLPPATYGVSEDQPAGLLDGLDSAGTNGGTALNPGDRITGAVLTFGHNAQNYNFGELLPSSISGIVHADYGPDCDLGPTSILLSGVTVHLLDATGHELSHTLTDSQGHYEFDNLLPGTYEVQEDQPAGYFDRMADIGSVGGTEVNPNLVVGVTLGAGVVATDYNFCEQIPVSISGFVYRDLNNNGVRDAGEAGISGVKLTLVDAQGNPTAITTVTDANGFYKFDGLAPDTYGVAETQPAGYYDGLDAAGSAGGVAHNPGDLLTGAVLVSGDAGVNYNFGELPPASISGVVNIDVTGNCGDDSMPQDKIPITGAVVHLIDGNGQIVGTTTTSAQGVYSFTNLAPGAYSVQEETPAGYFAEDSDVGSVGGVSNSATLITTIVLNSGVSATDYDFCNLTPVSLSGYVYVDTNNNGQRDPGETGISNVTLTLLGPDGTPTAVTAKTDSSGFYTFTGLMPGTYGVAEIQPSGYFDGLDAPGSAGGTAENPGDKITGASLTPSTNGTEYDFGELPPGSISGYVFQDGGVIKTNNGQVPSLQGLRDGELTPDDKLLSGVVIRLGDVSGQAILDANGNPITTVTNAQGFYQFTGLAPGVYSVFETEPSGYSHGINTAGTTGGIAFSPTTSVSPQVLQTLSVSVHNDAIVRIPVPAGTNSRDNMFSEVLVETPPPTTPPKTPTPPPLPPIEPPAPPLQIIPPAPPVGFAPSLPVLPSALLSNFATGIFVGAADDAEFTWHLSVVDAGSPRGEQTGDDALVQMTAMKFSNQDWNGMDLTGGTWTTNNDDHSELRDKVFGAPNAIPIVGDFTGDGKARMGVYIEGQWFIDMNGNGVWDAGDLWAQLGEKDDLPVVGDWDGDGKDDIGIFGRAWPGDQRAVAGDPGLPHAHNAPSGRHKNMPPEPERAAVGTRALKFTDKGAMRADLIDHVFQYGHKGDIPVVGDWSGHGTKTIGIFRDGHWYLDMDGDGKWSKGDLEFQFGQAGDIPVVGNFNGDGIDVIGVFRQGKWFIDTNRTYRLDAGVKVVEMGQAGDKPIVGDWDGSGKAQPGVYHDGALHHAPAAAKAPAHTASRQVTKP